MRITRGEHEITIVHHDAPHETGEGGWHGSFTLPDLESMAGVQEFNAPRRSMASPYTDWLSTMVGVEFDVPASPELTAVVTVKVPAARIVAISGNRIEWEGRADG